ncbi:MAG: tetratricopeptide repeat protein [Gammaproteobacteria bacterium]|nr:tetratricopeptide repeat protein [Gammaproteobacteria bacterium]
MPTPIKNKVLLIGWDAADWKSIGPLMDAGKMPALQSMVENGVSGNLSTLHPVLSPMLWTSIATGKRPFDHGVHGFSEPTADGKGVQPISVLARKTKAIWSILNQHEQRSVIVGWWPSHPAEPINGVMVSNHYQTALGPLKDGWPIAPTIVHPPEKCEELAELRFHPDEHMAPHILPFVPRAAEVDQEEDRRLASCLKIICEATSIHSCATELLENESWDFAAVYHDAIDHFGHGFMKYHPPRLDRVREGDFDIYGNVVTAGYLYHDMMLGRMLELVDDDTTVILVSDHGFHCDHLRPASIPREPAGPAIEHRDFGIFVMQGPGVRKDELIHGASVLDITPTLLTMYGLPVADDMAGKPLLAAFAEPPEVTHIPSWEDVAGDDGQHPPGKQTDQYESKAALEQLVALGYIESAGEDAEMAVEKVVRELQYNLAQSYMDADRNRAAEPILEDLYARYPLEYRFAIKLAMCYRALDKTDKLAPLVEELNNGTRRDAEVARKKLKEFADVARARRKARKEQREADEKAGIDPKDRKVEPIFDEEERKAIAELRDISRVNIASIEFLAGYVQVADGNAEEALEHLLIAEQSDVVRPGLHLQIGEAYLKLERWEDAERSFLKAGELDGVNANVHFGLCRTYLSQRENQKAADAALKAVGLRYHYPMAHYCLGMALHRMGRIDSAIEALKVALSQNPNFPEVHERLSTIYSKRLNEPDLALTHTVLAKEMRTENRRRRREALGLPIPEKVAVDLDEMLPKVPSVEREVDPKKIPRLRQPPEAPQSEPADDSEYITIVTGLPRSGTSMMMQILNASGLQPLTDELREADEDNPRGYFEIKEATQLRDNPSWVGNARGKSVKVIAQLLGELPQGYKYRVIFMQRNIDEVLDSQAMMLERLGKEGGKLAHEKMKTVFQGQLAHARKLLRRHGIPTFFVPYVAAIEKPELTAEKLAEFLGSDADAKAMAAAIDPSLYRQRRKAAADDEDDQSAAG